MYQKLSVQVHCVQHLRNIALVILEMLVHLLSDLHLSALIIFQLLCYFCEDIDEYPYNGQIFLYLLIILSSASVDILTEVFSVLDMAVCSGLFQ